MAVNAPVVEFFENVYDSSGNATGSIQSVVDNTDPSNPVSNLWNAGIVDAGSQSSKKVIYIFNNHYNAADAGTSAGSDVDRSDMQDVTLGVVSNEAGSVGNKTGAVYEGKWCNILTGTDIETNTDVTPSVTEISAATELGKSSTDSEETTLKLTADGLDPSKTDEQYRIKGTKNDGTLTNSAENFAKISAFINLPANAAAGTHKFRLRVTYSYT